MTNFKKAVKGQTTAKIALTGPSGSGKTMGALLLAQGLGGKTCVIDTENSSASLYADKWDGWEYDVATILPPYTGRKYFDLIAEAIKSGYDNIIIDSATHLWAGEGGLLQQKDALDSRGGNSYTNWAPITKISEQFKSLILNAPVNVIVTMRSKQEYVMEANERGKQAPKKVGLAPIQRDGLEYEFTCVLDVGMDHQFQASKDRTDLFDGVITKISPSIGTSIKQWLAGGEGSTSVEVREKFLLEWTEEQKPSQQQRAPVSNAVRNMGQQKANPAKQVGEFVTMNHINHLTERAEKLEVKFTEMRQIIKNVFGKETATMLTKDEYEALAGAMEASTGAEFLANIVEMSGKWKMNGAAPSTTQAQASQEVRT